MVSDYKMPITTTSERILVAIEVKDAKAMAAGIKKLFDGDPTMKAREFEGLVIWETVEEQEYKPQSPPSYQYSSVRPGKKETPVQSPHKIRRRGRPAGARAFGISPLQTVNF